MIRRLSKPTGEDLELENFIEACGNRLTEVREGAGLSLAQLAEQLRMQRAHLYELESGGANFTLRTIFRLATVLNVDARDLMPNGGDAPLSRATFRFVCDRLDRIQALLQRREEQEAERQRLELERQRLDQALIDELKSFSELPKLIEQLPKMTQQWAKPPKPKRGLA